MPEQEQDWSWVTSEMYHEALEEVVSDMAPSSLLAVPGVHEALREGLNNEVLAHCAADAERCTETGRELCDHCGTEPAMVDDDTCRQCSTEVLRVYRIDLPSGVVEHVIAETPQDVIDTWETEYGEDADEYGLRDEGVIVRLPLSEDLAMRPDGGDEEVTRTCYEWIAEAGARACVLGSTEY